MCTDVRAFVEIRDDKIGDILLINHFDLYGNPMFIDSQVAFLSQFEHKKIKKDWQVGLNVDGMTGATKTAEHFVNGMRKIASDMTKD